MLSFFRRVLDKAYPSGPIHEPKESGDMANFRDATAENLNTIRTNIKNLGSVRDPENTDDLAALEKEYGIVFNPNLTEQERIDNLKASVFKKKSVASDDDLQARLDAAGFDLTVYNNSPNGPAVDPAIFIDQNFIMGAMFGDYYAGNTNAYAGRVGGSLLVNGRIFNQRPAYYGAGIIYAGNDLASAGYYERLEQTLKEYAIPADSGAWPLIFFIGGPATFNPDGSIASIQQGFVAETQRTELESIILKTKPLFTWCGMIITYT